MLIVGLTGIMGSGKSTVSHLLAEQGAVVVDADQLARQAIAPATPGFAAVVARFGSQVVDEQGLLHRPRLAQLAFADAAALADLEAIIHPQVARLQARQLQELPTHTTVVVLEIPLLFESDSHQRCDVTLAVACTGRHNERLASRALPAAVQQRMLARQLPEEEKCRLAHQVIDNSGPLSATRHQIIRLWPWLLAQPATCWPHQWLHLLQEKKIVP